MSVNVQTKDARFAMLMGCMHSDSHTGCCIFCVWTAQTCRVLVFTDDMACVSVQHVCLCNMCQRVQTGCCCSAPHCGGLGRDVPTGQELQGVK